MEVTYNCRCGLGVHAKTVVACLIKNGKKEIRASSTMTDDLLQLLDWLVRGGCTHAAIESTGVYWKPVFNILEGRIGVILVNARHYRGVPGRKTDVRDCEWLADLLRHGLLKASFIPPSQIRELRGLTRYRQGLVREQAALASRIQGLAGGGDIKLGQVAGDGLGVSGRLMLRAPARGETGAEKMSDLARRSMGEKKPQLKRALEGRLTKAQGWILAEMLDRYDEVEAALKRVEEHIGQEVENSYDPFVGGQ